MIRLDHPEDLAALHEKFAATGPATASASANIKEIYVTSTHRLENQQAPLKIRVPGSKSFTSRAIVLAGLCKRPVLLESVLLSDDSYWGLDVLLRLGFSLDIDTEACTVAIHRKSESTAPRGSSIRQLQLGMAGTLARFVPALLLNSDWIDAQGVELTGERRLCERPLLPLTQALRELGADIVGDSLPIRVKYSQLAGACSISGAVSGQFFSGLVLAGSAARHAVRIQRTEQLVQPDYVRMTIAAAREFGAVITDDPDLCLVTTQPVPELYPAAGRYVIEADASTACYFFAIAVVFDLDLEVTNLGSSTLQPDLRFTKFLERLGARFEIQSHSVRHVPRGSRELLGGFEMDFSDMSDQALTAGVLALFANAPIRIFGIGHIRKHESDRISCFVENVVALGVTANEEPAGFTVAPLSPEGGAQGACGLVGVWKTHRDHRFAMSGAILAMLAPGVSIENPSCCEKTAPGFFVELERMGVEFR
jgi:3-phosphoshikimate 1-carboxyvinyltransferase